MSKLLEIHSRYNQLLGQRKVLEIQKNKSIGLISDLKKKTIVLGKCVTVFEQLLDTSLKEKLKVFDDMVTQGLKSVIFDQNLEFKSTCTQKRDKLWIDLNTIIDGDVQGNALESFGGAVVVLESFILRLLVSMQQDLARFMILDEPFKQVSKEYISAMSKLCKELCDKLDMDLLMITHTDGLLEFADTVYDARKSKKGLKFKKVK